MALTKCPECGKEVSSEADSCPNCGTALKTKEASASKKAGLSPAVIFGCIAAAAVVIVLIVLFATGVIGGKKDGSGGTASAHSLVCTMSEKTGEGMTQEAEITIGFDDSETKVKDIAVKMEFDLGDESLAQTYLSLLGGDEDGCGSLVSGMFEGAKLSKCDMNASGTKIKIDAYTSDLSGVTDDDLPGSKADAKKQLESSGFSCK